MLGAKKGIISILLGILILIVFVVLPGQVQAIASQKATCPSKVTVGDGIHTLCKRTLTVNHSTTGVSFKQYQVLHTKKAIFVLTGATETKVTFDINKKVIIHPSHGAPTLEVIYRGLSGSNNFKIEFKTVPVVFESGSLNVVSNPRLLDINITPGTNNVVILGAILSAQNEDVLISSITLANQDGMNWDENLDAIQLIFGGESYGASFSFGDSITINLSREMIVRQNQNAEIYLTTNVLPTAPTGHIDAKITDISGVGVGSMNEIKGENASGVITAVNPFTTDYDVNVLE